MSSEPTAEQTAAAPIDFNALAAAEFHELKNQIGELALELDEIAAEHPDLGNSLNVARLNCRAIMDRLVEVLTIYKNDIEQLRLNVEAHSPAEFVEEMVADTRSLAPAHIEIVGRIDQAPPFWFFDRYLTEVALLNAVHNSLKNAHSRIEIAAIASEGGLLFCVCDDSPGYPEAVLETQGLGVNTSQASTGLGLFFARTIADSHRNNGRAGALRLGNSETGGATFSLWLP